LNLAKENITSQEENVNQAKESLRIAKVQYQQGLLTNIEEMDTELALIHGRDQLSASFVGLFNR
jgi:outer membrane protein TolC